MRTAGVIVCDAAYFPPLPLPVKSLASRRGRGAVDLFKAHRPDLTLMDIKMPVMTGTEAIDEIVAHSPSARLIVVTASACREERHDVPVLKKGFSKRELLTKIESSLQDHRPLSLTFLLCTHRPH